MNDKHLSKTISYALRHDPWKFELELDDEGWVDIDKFLFSLNETEKWCDVRRSDIERIIELSDKKRFEIQEGKIRASYGHSFSNRILKTNSEPPEILYHGTAKRFIESIKNEGLLPKGRQYVHLSVDEETAIEVGKRKDSRPVILVIRAREAWNGGCGFYQGNEKIWLADFIDPGFISF